MAATLNRSVSGANVMSRDIFLLGKENFVSREFKLFQPLWSLNIILFEEKYFWTFFF